MNFHAGSREIIFNSDVPVGRGAGSRKKMRGRGSRKKENNSR